MDERIELKNRRWSEIKVSRRSVLKALAGLGLAALSGSGCFSSSPKAPPSSENTPLPFIPQPTVEEKPTPKLKSRERKKQTEKIIKEIQQKYGVEILTVDDKNLRPGSYPKHPIDEETLRQKIHPLDWETPELAQVIFDTLSAVPAVGDLIQVIFVSVGEDSGTDTIPQEPTYAVLGSYLGTWRWFGASETASKIANGRKAISLEFSKRIPLDKINTLEITKYCPFEGYCKEPMTFRLAVQKSILHEIAHAFEFEGIREVYYKKFVQARPEPDPKDEKKVAQWREEFHRSNPIYSTFSQVVTLDDRLAHKRHIESLQDLSRDYFFELFADYFATSFLDPEFLTPKERRYFENIYDGLRKNGWDFLRQLVENPEILLEGISE